MRRLILGLIIIVHLLIMLVFIQPLFASEIPSQDKTEIANILFAESANDAQGWTPKLNTYNKGRRQHESLLSAMQRVCSAHRANAPQYRKAKAHDFNAYEHKIYNRILIIINNFTPDKSWRYIHHENIDAFYNTEQQAITHLKKAWGVGIDYQNYKKIGKETYFAKVRKVVKSR